MVFILTGVAMYTVLAGADFGAGLWQLLAGRSPRGERIREHAHRSMAPVWEANHVWLIFVITVFWTAYPVALGSIASTLAVALSAAALGIIFRGAAYALRLGAANQREAGVIDTIFSLSSVITPFCLGAAVGAIATDRVPVGNAAGHLLSSWLNGPCVLIGVLAVASCAYLAAVYLAADAARLGDDELQQAFRLRALAMGVVAGGLALGGVVVLETNYHSLYHSLVDGSGLPALVVSVLAGAATIGLVWRHRYEWARYSAALAVAAIVAGWALARWPVILPGLTVYGAAAGHDTLVWIVVAVVVGGLILFPALALLFGLSLTGRFRGQATPDAPVGAAALRLVTPSWPVRVALACLVAGFGLLNVAEAQWAHAVGVLCLLAFVVVGFRAVIGTALAGANPASPAGQTGSEAPPRQIG
jgi:cytochrome d ubiquinol oxidase subunit II